MKTPNANGNGIGGAAPRAAVHRAINWVENYVSKNPHAEATTEVHNIIRDLEGVSLRPNVDELLALLGQIAISAGRQEKIGMRQRAQLKNEN